MHVLQDTDVDPRKIRQEFGVLESLPAKVPGRSHTEASNVVSISKNSEDSRLMYLAGMAKAAELRCFIISSRILFVISVEI